MLSSIASSSRSNLSGPLYVLFSLLSVEKHHKEIRQRISEDSRVQVYDIDKTLSCSKSPLYGLERRRPWEFYEDGPFGNISDAPGNGPTHPFGPPNFFTDERGMQPRGYIRGERELFEQNQMNIKLCSSRLQAARANGYRLVAYCGGGELFAKQLLSSHKIEQCFDLVLYCPESKPSLKNKECGLRDILIRLLGPQESEQIIIIDKPFSMIDWGRDFDCRGQCIDSGEMLDSTYDSSPISGDLRDRRNLDIDDEFSIPHGPLN